jgi:hypothetical protein
MLFSLAIPEFYAVAAAKVLLNQAA